MNPLPDAAPSRGLTRGVPLRQFGLPLALLLLLIVACGPSLTRHARMAMRPDVCADDVAQHIVPYLHTFDRTLFAQDTTHAYFRANHPVGYRILFTTLARVIDPVRIGVWLPYALFLVFLLLTGLTAYRLGGLWTGFAVTALALSSPFFLWRMVGAFPRAFGFPLAAALGLALVYGRTRWIAAITVFAMAFYPTLGVIGGLALALVLVVLPARDRGDAAGWSWRRRLAVLALTAGLCGLVWTPTTLATRPFGPMITQAEVATYPESGPHGRSTTGMKSRWLSTVRSDLMEDTLAAVCNRHACWFRLLHRTAVRAALLPGEAWTLIGFCAGGLLLLLGSGGGGRRLAILPLAALAAHGLAYLVWPRLFHPVRYLTYTWPWLVLVLLAVIPRMLPTAVFRAFRPNQPAPRSLALAGVALSVLVTATVLAAWGGPLPARTGLTRSATTGAALLRFAATLPADALIAGWPPDMDLIPFFSRRQVFVSREIHLAYHQAYIELMRRRMRALLDAYYATTPAPLLRLRDQFGVTHLVVNPACFADPPPAYFAPFDDWVQSARAGKRPADFEVFRQQEQAGVFSHKGMFVLDLTRVQSAASP